MAETGFDYAGASETINTVISNFKLSLEEINKIDIWSGSSQKNFFSETKNITNITDKLPGQMEKLNTALKKYDTYKIKKQEMDEKDRKLELLYQEDEFDEQAFLEINKSLSALKVEIERLKREIKNLLASIIEVGVGETSNSLASSTSSGGTNTGVNNTSSTDSVNSNNGASIDSSSNSVQQISSSGFVVPVALNYVSSEYGMRTRNGKQEMHYGIDLVADKNSKICAVAEGRVVEISSEGGYGNHICIEHVDENGEKYWTMYAHLSDTDFASALLEGQKITQGTILGVQGSTGDSSGPHLHFEVRKSVNSMYYGVDPAPYLEGLI